MKLEKRTAILAILAAFTVAAVFFRLENWVQHEENPLMILLTAALMPACIVLGVMQLVQGVREKAWLWLVLGVLAATVCLWGALTYWRIPFCLECNVGVTPKELGWMSPWFFGE